MQGQSTDEEDDDVVEELYQLNIPTAYSYGPQVLPRNRIAQGEHNSHTEADHQEVLHHEPSHSLYIHPNS